MALAAVGALLACLEVLCASATRARAADVEPSELAALFPGTAGAVRMGVPAGNPRAAEVRADGRLVGYAFSTHDVAASLGYGGKPIDIHVGLGLDGVVKGARLARHEEPILVIGVDSRELERFVAGLAGLDVRQGLHQAASKAKVGQPDHVAGATVSSTVMKHAVLRAARSVAQSRLREASEAAGPRVDVTSFVPQSWQELAASGAIARMRVSQADVLEQGSPRRATADGLFIELFTALLTPPTVGQNLLGQRAFERLQSRLGADQHAVLVAANGAYSFKGTQWRQTGVFERIQLVQGSRTFRFAPEQHENVETLAIADAPELREIGIFTLAPDAKLEAAEPWRLELIAAPEVTGAASAKAFPLEYRLPRQLVEAPSPPLAQPRSEPQPVPQPAPQSEPRPAEIAAEKGAEPAPRLAQPQIAEPQEELWVEIWRRRRFEVAVTVLMLLGLTAILFSHDVLVRDVVRYRVVRLSFLVFTVVFLGLYAGAQLSVINIVTFVHAALAGFNWDQFLLDPLSFVLWSFVALALLFWGRGVFCGWLCPFGALQELLNEVARKLGLRQISVPWSLHERLWPIKYVAFLVILGVSFKSATMAFQIAEIEPFKTVVALKLARTAPFVAYALGLLIVGLFIERFFCRYLCPLGAGLAIPARLRLFEWLKRRPQCGRECRICATQCTVQAINPIGAIVPNECIYCLQCQSNYYNSSVCLPLKQRAQRQPGVPVRTPPSQPTLETRHE